MYPLPRFNLSQDLPHAFQLTPSFCHRVSKHIPALRRTLSRRAAVRSSPLMFKLPHLSPSVSLSALMQDQDANKGRRPLAVKSVKPPGWVLPFLFKTTSFTVLFMSLFVEFPDQWPCGGPTSWMCLSAASWRSVFTPSPWKEKQMPLRTLEGVVVSEKPSLGAGTWGASCSTCFRK